MISLLPLNLPTTIPSFTGQGHAIQYGRRSPGVYHQLLFCSCGGAQDGWASCDHFSQCQQYNGQGPRQVSATQRPGMGKDPLTHDKDSDAPIAAHALRQTAPLCARCPESVRDSAQVVNITLTSMALPRCRYDSDRTEPPSCCGTDLASLRSLPHCLPHTAVLSAIALHLQPCC